MYPPKPAGRPGNKGGCKKLGSYKSMKGEAKVGRRRELQLETIGSDSGIRACPLQDSKGEQSTHRKTCEWRINGMEARKRW